MCLRILLYLRKGMQVLVDAMASELPHWIEFGAVEVLPPDTGVAEEDVAGTRWS